MSTELSIDHGTTHSEIIRFDSVTGWAGGRHGSIGSSEAAILLGYGYAGSSKYSLWAEKRHKIKPEYTQSTLTMFEKGKLAEPYLSGLCRLDHGWELQHDSTPEQPAFRRSIEYPFMTASLDAWMIENGQHVAVEFKNINEFAGRFDWSEFKGKAPLKYTIQMQHQLAVTGWKYGYVVALCGFQVIPVKVQRHDGLIESLIYECQDFWDMVQTGREPEIDDSEATQGTLNRMFSPKPRDAKHLNAEDSKLLSEYLRLETELAQNESDFETVRNQLTRLAEGSEWLVSANGVMYSYKTIRGGKTKKLRAKAGNF